MLFDFGLYITKTKVVRLILTVYLLFTDKECGFKLPWQQTATSRNVIDICRRNKLLRVAAVHQKSDLNTSLYVENKVSSFVRPCVSTGSAVLLFGLLLMKLTS